jgi:hypothetical protein
VTTPAALVLIFKVMRQNAHGAFCLCCLAPLAAALLRVGRHGKQRKENHQERKKRYVKKPCIRATLLDDVERKR